MVLVQYPRQLCRRHVDVRRYPRKRSSACSRGLERNLGFRGYSKSRRVFCAALEHDGINTQPLEVIIAGGGLGGLFTAICLLEKGFKVTVLERTAEYKPLGGPIQLASNGMGVVHAISDELAERIQSVSRPFWSTRSGIRDGLTSKWMFTFDAITEIPAADNLPFSLCIDRSDLQAALIDHLNSISPHNDVVRLDSGVSRYERSDEGVLVELEDGRTLSGDILIGADGIWSTVRSQLFNENCQSTQDKFAVASYTGFKLYSGLPQVELSEYFDIGYCAFIGPNHYFVVCPDRNGRVQWYAFVRTPPHTPNCEAPKETLREIFTEWAPEVKCLIEATSAGSIVQRDLLDRAPSITKSWADGRVTLLGDSCHATMPNIGQGTGLAFEDGYVLAHMLAAVQSRSDIPRTLQRFYRCRIIRTSIIQGLGRLNSEAIKFLTPLLPIRSVVDFFLSPLLPRIFFLQFKYCYSLCPIRVESHDSVRIAAMMNERHFAETLSAWAGSEDSSGPHKTQ
ncbi:MAG: hypothetical protein CMB73_05855 [Euryarchaeota archaeon]|nr:hypothetical protein [Euryarchaeota archaeon]